MGESISQCWYWFPWTSKTMLSVGVLSKLKKKRKLCHNVSSLCYIPKAQRKLSACNFLNGLFPVVKTRWAHTAETPWFSSESICSCKFKEIVLIWVPSFGHLPSGPQDTGTLIAPLVLWISAHKVFTFAVPSEWMSPVLRPLCWSKFCPFHKDLFRFNNVHSASLSKMSLSSEFQQPFL